MQYIKQLDSLRAIAVLLVIVSHWLPKTNIVNRYTPNGAIGVYIFFVLSGFLISRILFDSRNKATSGHLSNGTILKNFYVRRSLRIFPIYYLTIFALLIFHSYTGTNIKEAFPYFVTYTSNFYFFIQNTWDGPTSHLWSLAVEEQFYLFWPFVLLFTRERYLLPVIIAFIIVGPITSFLVSNHPLGGVLTFSCFDSLGLGALLAWQITYRTASMRKFYRNISWMAALAAVYFLWYKITSSQIFFPLGTTISIMALWLITYIVLNAGSQKRLFNLVWSNRILLFLGKISYGLYLYHNLIPLITSKVIKVYFNPLLPDLLNNRFKGGLILIENLTLLILISWLSYVFIEKKFLLFKKYFEYKADSHKPQQTFGGAMAIGNRFDNTKN